MSKTFSLSSFVAGFMLGVLLIGAWLMGNGASATSFPTFLPPSNSSFTASSATASGQTASGAVSVSDQAAGSSVTVESVTVTPPGVWVAVREMTSDNQLGNVLGAARVGGPRTNVVVPLLRNTAPNTRYAVELYRDNNDNLFDLSTDSVYVDFQTGERVVAYFTTTS